jgi:hypothetical protein
MTEHNEPSKGATPVISDSRVTFLVRIWDSAHPGSHNHDATLALTELLALRSSSERLRSQVEQMREQNEALCKALMKYHNECGNRNSSIAIARWDAAIAALKAALPERAP